MKNPFDKQSQFELFPGAPGAAPKDKKDFFWIAPVALSFENMIVIGVAFIMAMIVSFSFGIEKGKRLKLSALKEDVTAVEAKISSRSKAVSNVISGTPAGEISVQTAAVTLPQPELFVGTEKIVENQEKAEGLEKKVDKTPSLEKIHTIQVSSFKKKSMADADAQRLQGLSYDAFVQKKGSYYVVCVGHFGENDDAQSILQSLKKKYPDCYKRSL